MAEPKLSEGTSELIFRAFPTTKDKDYMSWEWRMEQEDEETWVLAHLCFVVSVLFAAGVFILLENH